MTWIEFLILLLFSDLLILALLAVIWVTKRVYDVGCALFRSNLRKGSRRHVL